MHTTNKTTLIIGASESRVRYSYLAAERLLSHGYSIACIGLKPGSVLGVPIQTGTPDLQDIDTVTLYINPKRQPAYYDYLIQLAPRRVIFNPGTENAELEDLLNSHGVETLEACTLVMLATGRY